MSFVLIEGVDHSGKTTQAKRLVEALQNEGHDAVFMHFPERSTAIGTIIDQHLKGEHSDMSREAIHLLFCANRWEFRDEILRHMSEGRHVVMDRYTHSGVAFSLAKGLEYEWCVLGDKGLPAPSFTFFLDISPEEASGRGDDYGSERFEQLEFQAKVHQSYKKIVSQTNIPHVVLDVTDKDVEEVHSMIVRQLKQRNGFVYQCVHRMFMQSNEMFFPDGDDTHLIAKVANATRDAYIHETWTIAWRNDGHGVATDDDGCEIAKYQYHRRPLPTFSS